MTRDERRTRADRALERLRRTRIRDWVYFLVAIAVVVAASAIRRHVGS